MESNRDSLQIILNNKMSEYYELIKEKYRLESEMDTIKLMADMIQKYSWALDDVFIYLEKAGQAMVDADQMLTEETLRESYK